MLFQASKCVVICPSFPRTLADGHRCPAGGSVDEQGCGWHMVAEEGAVDRV